MITIFAMLLEPARIASVVANAQGAVDRIDRMDQRTFGLIGTEAMTIPPPDRPRDRAPLMASTTDETTAVATQRQHALRRAGTARSNGGFR